jgi:hypothetical protein
MLAHIEKWVALVGGILPPAATLQWPVLSNLYLNSLHNFPQHRKPGLLQDLEALDVLVDRVDQEDRVTPEKRRMDADVTYTHV